MSDIVSITSRVSTAIVLDASVVVEVLLASVDGKRTMQRLVAEDVPLHAPELLDIEVLHVLRRAVARELMTTRRAEQAIRVLESFPLTRHAHGPLRRRCWQLRANLSVYDATYVALAEGLGARLFTRDARLGRAQGLATAVEVV
ncbi:MAG: type II toxin-antitoxin system VapC family toxin [Gemmatimonas sp.]